MKMKSSTTARTRTPWALRRARAGPPRSGERRDKKKKKESGSREAKATLLADDAAIVVAVVDAFSGSELQQLQQQQRWCCCCSHQLHARLSPNKDSSGENSSYLARERETAHARAVKRTGCNQPNDDDELSMASLKKKVPFRA